MVKNGVGYNLIRQNLLLPQSGSFGGEAMCLGSVVFNVQIHPHKFQSINTPVHFYGELVKTKNGAHFLAASRDIDFLMREVFTEETPLVRKRAALWALGHIGSHPNGYELLKRTDLIQKVVAMAEESPFLSLRGTCTYALGLLSKTLRGKRELEKFNWVSSKENGDTSVCLPRDPSKFFHIAPLRYQGNVTQNLELLSEAERLTKVSPLSQDE